MSKSKVSRSSIVIFLSLLLLLAPLSLFPAMTVEAQESEEANQPDAEIGNESGEIIDAETIKYDIFPGIEMVSVDELLQISDPYSQTTENPDGTFTRVTYSSPVNWQDAEGNWSEIDSTIVEEETDGYSFVNASNFFKFRLPRDSADGKTCSLELDGKKFKLHLIGQGKNDYKGGDKEEKQKVKEGKPETSEETPALEPTPQLDCVAEDNQAYFYDSGKGYSLEFILFPSTIEQLIKLESASAPNSFDFKLDLEGMDAEKDELGNLHFLSQEDGSELFIIYAPLMMDSSEDGETGDHAMSSDVELEITKDKENKAHLTITADPAWLADPARVYPVFIDPSIALLPINPDGRQDTLLQGDAYVSQRYPNNNYGAVYDTTYNRYCLRTQNIAGESKALRTIVGFDVRDYLHNRYGDLNMGGDIQSSHFRIYCYKAVCGPSLVYLYRVASTWREETVCWNSWPATSSELSHQGVAQNSWADYNVTSLTQKWLAGYENGGYNNQGLALTVYEGGNANLRFNARENASCRPHLSITYTPIGCAYNMDETPKNFIAGETKPCSVYVMNTADSFWPSVSEDPNNPVRLAYYITNAAGSVVSEGSVDLPREVAGGEALSLSLPVTAPSTAGSYKLNLSMKKEGQYWFYEKGVDPLEADITVVDSSALPPDSERTASALLGSTWMSNASLGGISANLYTGNAVGSATDLSVSGRGAFALSRTYNSGAPSGQTTLFGPNGFCNLDVKVKEYTGEYEGFLAYYDASGKSHLLVQAQKDNTYVCPEGYFFKVESNPDYTNPQDTDDNKNWKYKVTGTSGTSQHFDDAGKLIYIAGASRESAGSGNYKNKTKIIYNFDGNGNIQAVDASGRTFTIMLSGGKISSVSEDASWADADGHVPRAVSYEYNGPGGRLSKITLNPGDHWSSITYSGTDPNLIVEIESKVDAENSRKAYYEYTAGKLTAYRNPRSSSSSDDTYKTTITYNAGDTIVSSPAVSNYVGTPGVQFCTKYIYNSNGDTTDVFTGVNPDGSGGLGRKSYEWNSWHQVTKVTDYENLSTPLGSTSYTYDGKGNASKVEDDLPEGQKAISNADYTASQTCTSNLTVASAPDGDIVNNQYNSGETYFKGTSELGAETMTLKNPDTENVMQSLTLPAPLTNLLENASMERDEDENGIAEGWTKWENINPAEAASYQVYTVPEEDSAAAGRKVQRLVIQGNTNIGNMVLYQEVAVQPDSDYALSFSYRNSPDADIQTRAYIKQLDSNNNIVGEDYTVLMPSSEWAHDSFTFTTESNTADVQIALYIRPSQINQDLWADFDAVNLLEGSRDTMFNYVENSSFERSYGESPDKNPKDWAIVDYMLPYDHWVTDRCVSGNASLMMKSGEATQIVNVKKNTRYLFSCYVYNECSEEDEDGARIEVNGYLTHEHAKGYWLDWNDYSSGDFSIDIRTSGKWLRPYRVINTGDRNELEISLLCLEKTYFDDISLIELPDDSTTTYDARGNYAEQITTPSDANGYYSSYLRTDPVGNVIEARDARSSDANDEDYLFSYTYNELSQITNVVTPLVHNDLGQDPQSYAATYGYDTAGRLLSYNDFNNPDPENDPSTDFAYNQASQVTSKTDPNLKMVQIEYNEAGLVKKAVYPNGWEVYYAYRQNGSLDKVAFKDPQDNVTNPYTFNYDGAGRLTSVSDSQTNITLIFGFDMASRLTSYTSDLPGTDNDFTSSYTYTKGGRLTSLKYSKSTWGNDISTNFSYGNTGELNAMTLPNSDTINYIYEDRGRQSSIRYVNDPSSSMYYNSSSFTYDSAGRLASITHNFHDSGLKTSYEYDAVGNITRLVQDNMENIYTYDELSRLTSWTEKTDGQITWEEKYGYDGNGNITQIDKNGTLENHAFDAANQCVDTGITYDDNGNLTSNGEWDYEYDRGSRLVSATNDTENLKVVFGYGPQGKRNSKTAYERDGQGQYTVEKYTRFYHYDSGGNILCETDALGSIIHSYAYDLSGHPVAFTQDLGQGPETFYIHTNARGDVICITDDVMNWVKKFSYDPWGIITLETVSSGEYNDLECPYRYAGYFYDGETGLYCMPSRYYSPVLRTFLTKDPASGKKSNPLTLNPYQYCGDNPMSNVDPSGQMWEALVGWMQNYHVGDCGVSKIDSAKALWNEGGRRLQNFQSSMAGMKQSINISMGGFRGVSFDFSSFMKYKNMLSIKKAVEMVFDAFNSNVREPMPTPSHDKRSTVVKVYDAIANNPFSKILWGAAQVLTCPSAGGAAGEQLADGLYTIGEGLEGLRSQNYAGNPYHNTTDSLWDWPDIDADMIDQMVFELNNEHPEINYCYPIM